MSQFKTLTIVAVIAALAGGAWYFAASSTQNKADAGASASAAAGKNGDPSAHPVSVSTVLAQQRDYPVRISANGTVSALNTVDIRPQVTSTVSKVHIREGQFVKAGELLFTLDSRADEVNLAKAQAQLDKDLATLADYQRQLVRSKELVAKKFVAQSALDTSQAAVDAQAAVVASDRAAVVAAKVALSYDRIVAPSAGRTGIISVYPGSLVQPSATTPALVTITQIDPIAIMFPLPQRNLPDALESMRRTDSYVTARLPDGVTQFKGKLQFVDNAVDAASGTVKVKAIFDNKEMKLWPGAYVTVELSVQTLKDAVVVPQDAIIVGARGKSVYAVTAEGKAELRPVVVTQSFGTDAVVTGIAAGTRIVLDGKQNLRPGAVVKQRDNEAKDSSAKAAANRQDGAGSQEKPAEKSASAASAS
ncbi:efflux RND transporter periplasmic adaptor subunit [Undibacterium oligocarboniphilum]|uniref:Efflux RND transporter periplasmic adaptor subunit n=1 Tax=Undibacterium oligocarboniphilum TaxID=666702 RepID=A0A850QJ19_9BURK|nr:efflux RND transporter periplasmic adaptor subunit [Undibacterium oligocarboniphilum]MBC3869849.1 efflux RND transporter periplasmic adaptor subunit [Undibacterium oligocarboniphilum]NVO77465.1 efflux RND transporter periplasmic adaptor subunit [Undibacterium oligocarboniphilum]